MESCYKAMLLSGESLTCLGEVLNKTERSMRLAAGNLLLSSAPITTAYLKVTSKC